MLLCNSLGIFFDGLWFKVLKVRFGVFFYGLGLKVLELGFSVFVVDFRIVVQRFKIWHCYARV
jgi:hypothetical protein